MLSRLVVIAATTAAFLATKNTPRAPHRPRAAGDVEVSLEKPLGLVLEENVPNKPEGLYVAEIRDSGSAYNCDEIYENLQLEAVGGVAVDAMGFDDVMDMIVDAPSPVVLRFSSPYCLVKVTSPKGDLSFSAKKGDNLRAALLANKAPVYDFKGSMMNCNGGGQCGLCAVRVADGAFGPRQDWEEAKVARLGPDARLACQTVVAGNSATVELQPR
mmetsp:Transcript_23940/g.71819  ORF Transcript_23940/g.71819 Transcript_23940/m.71819 type:complete len:215 (-) Transcript_23940:50-694(-)